MRYKIICNNVKERFSVTSPGEELEAPPQKIQGNTLSLNTFEPQNRMTSANDMPGNKTHIYYRMVKKAWRFKNPGTGLSKGAQIQGEKSFLQWSTSKPHVVNDNQSYEHDSEFMAPSTRPLPPVFCVCLLEEVDVLRRNSIKSPDRVWSRATAGFLLDPEITKEYAMRLAGQAKVELKPHKYNSRLYSGPSKPSLL